MERQLHIDNHTLVEECKNGDKEALNLFYLRFAPRMLSVIRRYVNDVKDAEDILHDGFIVAFTRLGSLRDADKVDYWLATIMKNLSLQFLQSQDVAQMLHDIPEVEDTPQIDEIIDLATLETLIKKLPAGYQKVFRLAVLENKSHKEIAKLLGIAPNSSSSQLFHAKLMMRKLITDYKKQTGVWCLLLLCGGAGVLLWHNLMPSKSSSSLLSYESTSSSSTADSTLPSSSSTNSISLSPATEAGTSSSANTVLLSNIIPGNSDDTTLPAKNSDEASNQPNNELPNKLNNEILNESTDDRQLIAALSEKMDEVEEKSPERSDSVNVNDIPVMSNDEVYYAYLDDRDILSHRRINKSSFSDWSVRVSADAGLLAFNIDTSFGDDGYYSGSDWCQNPGIGSEEPNDPNTPDNPDNPNNSDNSNNSDNRIETRAPRRSVPGYKNYNSLAHTNYLPVSFSVAVNKALDNTFSVETGLTYTYLHTTFESLPSYSNCHWHYLGIPLKLNTKICNFNRVNMYMSLGGIMNIPLYSYADVTTTSGSPDLWGGRFQSSVVWSLSASYGVSIKLSKRVDVFLEPTLQYHFEHNAIVPNVWSDEKWGFSLPIGFRFNL